MALMTLTLNGIYLDSSWTAFGGAATLEFVVPEDFDYRYGPASPGDTDYNTNFFGRPTSVLAPGATAPLSVVVQAAGGSVDVGDGYIFQLNYLDGTHTHVMQLVGDGGQDYLFVLGGTKLTLPSDDDGLDQMWATLAAPPTQAITTGLWAPGGSGDLTAVPGVLVDYDEIFSGLDTADTFSGGRGADTADGGDGNDVLAGGTGDDYLDGGDDNDTVSGGLGDDYLEGWNGDDHLAGDEGADVLRGFFGHDTLHGGQGDDDLSGEAGDDVLYGGGASDVLKGHTGDDVLYGDGAQPWYAMDTAQQVYRLYQATLGRAPDPVGLASWTHALTSGALEEIQAAAGFVGSQEFQNVYGALDNSAFVTLLYNNVLGRAPDAGGLAAWTGSLDVGNARENVVLGFSNSQEFITATAADSRAYVVGNDNGTWSDEVFRVYQATLNRAPDVGGYINWINQLAGGVALPDVIDGFVGSTEFQNTYGALNDADFVELLYNNVLGRASDPGGLAAWTGHLDAGMARAQVVRGFSESQEFIAATRVSHADWVATNLGGDVLNGGAGTNTLWGGIGADRFVFEASGNGTHIVGDLENWDRLEFAGFGYGTVADALAHMQQDGGDVVFTDQGVEIRFANVQMGDITDEMVLL